MALKETERILSERRAQIATLERLKAEKEIAELDRLLKEKQQSLSLRAEKAGAEPLPVSASASSTTQAAFDSGAPAIVEAITQQHLTSLHDPPSSTDTAPSLGSQIGQPSSQPAAQQPISLDPTPTTSDQQAAIAPFDLPPSVTPTPSQYPPPLATSSTLVSGIAPGYHGSTRLAQDSNDTSQYDISVVPLQSPALMGEVGVHSAIKSLSGLPNDFNPIGTSSPSDLNSLSTGAGGGMGLGSAPSLDQATIALASQYVEYFTPDGRRLVGGAGGGGRRGGGGGWRRVEGEGMKGSW